MPKNKKKSKKILDKAKSIGNINIAHPFAFVKLPYHIQQASVKQFKHVTYEYASYMVQQWGIKSARQYRSFVQFFKPSGFPSNAPRTYHLQWESWDTFLNTDNIFLAFKEGSVTADELLPYSEALAWTQSQQFPTVNKFFEAWDAGHVPNGIPRQPQVRYKEFYPKGGWKYFLGKKIESRLDAAKNVEPICSLCKTVGKSDNVLTLVISSQGANVLAKQIEDNPELTAVKAYYWYHEYAEFIFELLDKMGTRQTDNSWLFPDLNALYYELGSVLEVYKPR